MVLVSAYVVKDSPIYGLVVVMGLIRGRIIKLEGLIQSSSTEEAWCLKTTSKAVSTLKIFFEIRLFYK